MFKIKLLFLCLSAVLLSCGATPSSSSETSSNTEVIVHYNGVEVSRKNSKYLSRAELTKLSDLKKDFIIIFSSEMCSACVFTSEQIKQANLKKKIYYLNLSERWVQQLAVLLEIKGVPFLMHVNDKGITVATKLGPVAIVNYLIPRFN